MKARVFEEWSLREQLLKGCFVSNVITSLAATTVMPRTATRIREASNVASARKKGVRGSASLPNAWTSAGVPLGLSIMGWTIRCPWSHLCRRRSGGKNRWRPATMRVERRAAGPTEPDQQPQNPGFGFLTRVAAVFHNSRCFSFNSVEHST